MSQTTPSTAGPLTVVLVHGAFADASSWTGVIERLQKEGVQVTAPANPLRGLSSDSAYIASVFNQIRVSVILRAGNCGIIRESFLQTSPAFQEKNLCPSSRSYPIFPVAQWNR
ncbi:MAG: alpha/beta hydrolase [Ktedonobacteraceae bacterium]|nr:alpha/beta hydrolase [Ktedonobacteraceae bacterium]